MEAWSDDFLGIWVKLGEEWIQSDGRWSLTIPATPLFQGKRLRIFYRTRTDYYDVQSLAGNHYRWVDPDWLNIPFTFSTGHRYADTDGGAYNGVGELVDAAMVMWSRLYWNGGINPVRGSPINIFAPNTTYDCGDGSGVPWSCANIGGNIWLISSHATQASVVSHELGHQLNYKFWANKRPANPGGSHSSGTCYPAPSRHDPARGLRDLRDGLGRLSRPQRARGGLRLRALVHGRDRGPQRPAELHERLGERALGHQVVLGPPRHAFGRPGRPLVQPPGSDARALPRERVANDGDARDMRFYETTYRNAASPGHQTHVSNIFDQNRH